MFDYVCVECGKVQEPIKKEGDWQVFDTKCSECGGELTIKKKDKKNAR